MSDTPTAGEQRWTVDAEATALVEVFNDAAESYSPELEWFAMSNDSDPPREKFVFEAKSYIDSAGLEALKDHGRTVTYIEAYAPESADDASVTIHVPVEGSVPETAEVEADA